MNSRVVTIVVGLIILVLGLAGLLYPERVLGFLGFTVLNPSSAAAALGEVRATYGGLFVVMGIFTVLAAMDPVAYRSRLLFIGFLWIGAGLGRLFGVFVDGNPGVFGWVGVMFELIMGGALVGASQAAPIAAVTATPTYQPTPTSPIAGAPPVPPPPL
jgi:hypothetical protein